MNEVDLSEQLSLWVDGVLSNRLPQGIAAFHFNLYDSPKSHDIEVVGCPTYDPADPDWACDDIFMSAQPRFELPHNVVGKTWERGLGAALRMLQSYVAGESSGANRLRQGEAVSVGFVDGELVPIWRRNDA